MLLMQVALSWPTSAITERVNGTPMMANTMQNKRPSVVTGAIFPYPAKLMKKSQIAGELFHNYKTDELPILKTEEFKCTNFS